MSSYIAHIKVIDSSLTRYILAFLYFLQITLVPISHYYFHLAEVSSIRSNTSDHPTSINHPRDIDKRESSPVYKHHDHPESEHSTHDPLTCSLCSGTLKEYYSWSQITISPNKIPIFRDGTNYAAPFLANRYSSTIPRGPPVFLS